MTIEQSSEAGLNALVSAGDLADAAPAEVKGPAPASGRSTIARTAAGRDRPDKPYEVRADKPHGLLLRVQPSGKRTYYVQVGRGRRIRIGPADTYTLKQAEERAKKVLLDPEAASTKAKPGTTLLEYIRSSYEEHALARLKNGAVSVARVKAVWKPLLNKRVADLAKADVDKIRNKRLLAGIQPATVNRDVASLRSVVTHWVAHNKGAEHPLRDLDALDVADDETVRYLAPDESARLRAALAERDAAAAKARAHANEWRLARGYEQLPTIDGYSDHLTPMVLLTLNTGMRQGELFSLAWENVDMRRKTISVLASHSKGNTTRTIPLNAEAMAVLTTISPAKPAGLVFCSPVTGGRFNNVKKAWAELTKAAEVPDLRWHDLRHDFASQLVMRGVPLFTVQTLLGHKNSRMTQRYAKLAPGTLADAVDRLGEV
jgi:integrase